MYVHSYARVYVCVCPRAVGGTPSILMDTTLLEKLGHDNEYFIKINENY